MKMIGVAYNLHMSVHYSTLSRAITKAISTVIGTIFFFSVAISVSILIVYFKCMAKVSTSLDLFIFVNVLPAAVGPTLCHFFIRMKLS